MAPLADRDLVPRVLNFILGAWLFLSAFAWPHSPWQRTNAWVVGLLTALVALTAMAIPRARYINTALAAWLFLSSVADPGMTAAPATLFNNSTVALWIFLISPMRWFCTPCDRDIKSSPH